ncbi:MAG: VCBS repeat-containing protein [Bacteroidales bacterium]|nr:VCBS repeat-containing protein [Bacteroidales bacterium]
MIMNKSFFYILLAAFSMSLNTYSQSSCCTYSLTGQDPGPGEAGETFGIGLGDIDDDGDLDAVIIDAYDDMEVYKNNGAGIFTYHQTYGSGNSWFGAYLVDVDGDTDPDIVVSAFYSGSGCEVWENDGSGNFTFAQGGIASSIAMHQITILDLNGDDAPDIFAPAYSGSGGQVWFNDGTGTFVNTNQSLQAGSATQAAMADFDDDGDPDAYVATTNGSPDKVFLNNGSGFFTPTAQELGNAFSSGAAASDVDGDGDMDVVVANWQVPSQVWLNDGNGIFSPGPQIDNDNYAKAVEISDIDYDCDDDVILGSYGSNGLQVWTNDGLGNFTLCFENTNEIYAHGIAVGDMNGDLMPDVWVGNFSSTSGDYIFLKSTPEFVYDTIQICGGDSVYIGCDWRYSDGDFLEAVNCDTLCWYHVYNTPINVSVTLDNTVLSAIPGYDAYQWFDCNTMLPVSGAISHIFNPEITGTYAVAISHSGCADTSACTFVQTPLVDFAGNPTYGMPPLTVNFTDLSTDMVDTWEWDFGDGNTSGQQNPTHVYTEGGQYSVRLKITGPGGSDSLVKQNYIEVLFNPPTAEFSGTPTTGFAPLEVQFTDLSVDSVNSWLWFFGDGGVAFEQNPSHTYETAGSYTVTLQISGPGGNGEMEKTDYINVYSTDIQADFTGTPTTGQAPLTVDFSDLSVGNIDSWAWDFGDGGTASVQNPTHEYTTTGSFTVSLTVNGPAGSSTETKTDYILIPVGMADNGNEAFVIYPNPVKDFLNIRFPCAADRKIILESIEGKHVFEKRTSNAFERIDISGCDPGIYALIIETNGETIHAKVVKKD